MTKEQIEAIYSYLTDRMSESNDEDDIASAFESVKTIILFNRGVCTNLITDDGFSISLFKDESFPIIRRKWDDDEIIFSENSNKVKNYIQKLPNDLHQIQKDRLTSAYMLHVIIEEYLL